MKELLSLPMTADTLAEYPDWAGLDCDGLEVIWSGEPLPATVPQALHVGYHLTFFPDWLDFWRMDRKALVGKFGSMEAVAAFYGGAHGRETLLERYREDLDRAEAWGAEYVVFHVSDVSVEEGYTYRWLHSHEAVIDAALEVMELLLRGRKGGFAFLVENQWWPGFTFTDPALTERLLSGIPWENKGIMLDTGHLMNTALDLRTQEEGAAYVREMLERHGALSRYVRGLHLHQSLSGAYVRAHTGTVPPLPQDYVARFCESYRHILRIDTHSPWTSPAVAALVERVKPEYLVHELSATGRAQRTAAVERQRAALGRGAGGWNRG